MALNPSNSSNLEQLALKGLIQCWLVLRYNDVNGTVAYSQQLVTVVAAQEILIWEL